MKATATELVTYWTCPFLWHVTFRVKEPLPYWGARRRFGNVIHAAIAEYERRGRRLEPALRFLEARGSGLPRTDLEEANQILLWRHERIPRPTSRPLLVEGSLRAHWGEHRLLVRVDRLDRLGEGLLLAEYKGGKAVDLELARTQLRILSAAVLDVFGRPPDRWELELLRSRELLKLPAERDPAQLRHFSGRLISRILEGDREPEPYEASFCRRCPARAWCPRVTARPRPLRPLAMAESPQGLLF